MAKRRTKKVKKIQKTIAFVLVILIFAFVLACYFHPPLYAFILGLFDLKDSKPEYRVDGDTTYIVNGEMPDLKMHFVDVGQGDSIIIELPDGKNVIIDAGEESEYDKLHDYIEENTSIERFDYAIATHADSDHIGAFDKILADYEVKMIYRPHVYYSGSKYNFSSSFNKGGKDAKKSTVNYGDFLKAVQDETYLEEMFLNDNSYDSIIASESSLININQKLVKNGKEELYLIYPSDGVAINDSTFAFINNVDEKEEMFLDIQKYLLSDSGKKMLEENGQRTWYGGVTTKADKDIFNKNWGIDTTEYLNVTKFPSKKVITSAINLYIERLRKPTHVVFCLDYSGSMYGEGIDELNKAMNYILNYDLASKDKLQFSEYDKITIIPFSSKVIGTVTSDGKDTTKLINYLNNQPATGSTALYDAVVNGLDILSRESNDYTKTIIAMTDGAANVGSFEDVRDYYNNNDLNIPVYSITFGSAEEEQLEEIAYLTNAKVFDGRTDLLKAFKDVRGYN